MIKSMLIRSRYKTAWNDYLWLLKILFRWLHNNKIRENHWTRIKAEYVIRAYYVELGSRVCGLAIVTEGFPLPSNVPVIVYSVWKVCTVTVSEYSLDMRSL